MGDITEVRVHGVSGTPPRAMLRTDPELTAVRPDEDGDIEVYAPRRRVDQLAGRPLRQTAYNWSKLTSGKARDAFWLLLLPYTLVNVAGWMLPQAGMLSKQKIGFIPAAVVRVAGVLVTAIFTVLAAAITLDLFVYSCLLDPSVTCDGESLVPGWSPGVLIIIGAVAPVVLVIGVAAWVGMERRLRLESAAAWTEVGRSGPEDPDPVDPARSRTVTDRALWQTHDLTQHLSLLHGAASLATMSVVLFRVGEAENLIWLPAAEGWLTMGLLPLAVLGVATMASAPVHAGRFRWAVLFITSLVSINALFLVGQLTQLDAVTHTDAPVGIRDLTVTLIVALAVGATLLVVMAGSNRVLVAAPAALILLAGLIGGTLGSGLHLLVLNMVASDQAIEPFPGMDWLSLGFMVLLLLALGAAALGIIGGWRQRSGDEPTAGLMRGIRAITSRIRLILGWLVVVVAVAALVFWFGGVRPQDEAIVSPFDYRATGPIVAGVVAFAVLGTIGLAWRYLGARAEEQADERAALRQWLALVGFGLGLGAIIWLLGGGRVPDVSIFGIVLKFDDLRQIATSVAVLVPTGFILSRLAATVRDRESRRATAILWDVGSFWPRWYHPFAAPYYTALAVPDLQAYVAEQTDGADAVILAAHSQGTVLGMAALLTSDLSDDQRAKVGFLSYGSPIVQLYGRLFPAHFDSTVVERLGELLGDAETTRWVNLWRDTDPIGGAVGLGQVDVQIDPDHQGDGHFRYEDTVDYDLARGIIAGHLG